MPGRLRQQQPRHQVLEHRAAPGEQADPPGGADERPAELEPVPPGHVAAGDGQEAGQALDGPALRTARRRLDAFASMTPSGSTVYADAAHRLLVSQSAALSAQAQAEQIRAVNGLIAQQIHGIRLAPDTSIRLTARQGRFPVTIVDGAGFPARVQVRLSSQKLEFRPIDEPGATCRAAGASETCTLDLQADNTTLKVELISALAQISRFVISPP